MGQHPGPIQHCLTIDIKQLNLPTLLRHLGIVQRRMSSDIAMVKVNIRKSKHGFSRLDVPRVDRHRNQGRIPLRGGHVELELGM